MQDQIKQFDIPHYGLSSNGDENNLVEQFGVKNPSLINNNYVTYSIYGVDKIGMFEGVRRYNEFHLIRQRMNDGWIGIYVPNLPPKKAVGNKDIKFIVERKYYLDRFMK